MSQSMFQGTISKDVLNFESVLFSNLTHNLTGD